MLFYQSFFRALTKMNEEPIATITFKYKTAQRKLLDRVVWDRLRQNSPVYNGDTIHTADLSEATIWFGDGTILELAENTMAQVFCRDDGSLGADLEKGVATVDSSEGSSGLTLTSENVSVQVKGGTKISAQKSEEQKNVSLTVQKGTASLADGSTFTAGKKFSVSETGETEAMLSVISPLPDEKILYFTEGLCPVTFNWNGNELTELKLTVATDKDFKLVAQELTLDNEGTTTLDLAKGTYYWKISSNGEKQESSTGKLQLIQALKPELLAPAVDYSYQFRKKTPSVRFIWSESATATAYNFVVSKNPDMSNPVLEQRSSSSSIIISTLKEGVYYWQVTPYYVVNRTGLANPSEISSFSINQRGELIAPTLYMPGNGEFVDKTNNSITLSWEMDSEASSYKVLVSQRENLAAPIFSRETTENYTTISGEDIAALKDGQYYWGVTQIDSEGNESPRSQIRAFYAVNGKIEQRTIFPPENYSVWRPLLNDTRFTWKSNVNFAEHIQISNDSSFNNIVFDSEVSNNSFYGVNLSEGTYWWRISTSEGSFRNATPGKMFTVVSELPAPILVSPSVKQRAVIRPTDECVFEWKESSGADYYRLKVFKNASETPLFDENFISGTTYSLDLNDYDEGTYRWELQSYSYETDSCSRRSSLLSNNYFNLRKIKPVTLKTPENGAKIDGWQAMENPPYFTWASKENFSKAEITLTKKDDKSFKPQVFTQNSYKSQLPSLSAGTYEWTVSAFTMDDLDISATKTYSFTVKPIPPFEKPENAHTEGGDLFDAKYLRKSHEIHFAWSPVKRAEAYIIEIFNENGKLLIREIINGNDSTSFTLQDLTKLSKGNFTWQVKAVRMDKKGKKIFIDGKPAGNTFTIDYSIKKDGGSKKYNGELYAQ